MKINKLLGIMAENKITQRQLATKLGVSKNTINAKLNEKVSFNTDEAIKICEILHIDDPELKAEIFLT